MRRTRSGLLPINSDFFCPRRRTKLEKGKRREVLPGSKAPYINTMAELQARTQWWSQYSGYIIFQHPMALRRLYPPLSCDIYYRCPCCVVCCVYCCTEPVEGLSIRLSSSKTIICLMFSCGCAALYSWTIRLLFTRKSRTF